MNHYFVCTTVLALTSSVLTGNARGEEAGRLEIPVVQQAAKRLITIDDISALRKIDSLSVSSDGRQFAIFVHQADAVANAYRTGWFVGSTSGGKLTKVGEGGVLESGVNPEGQEEEDAVAGGESRWSPDNQWIAYTLRRDGEIQLWRSRVDGSKQERVTRNAADVRDFAWSADGLALYFTTGALRSKIWAEQDARARSGYRYDEDLGAFTNLMQSKVWPSTQADSSLWVVSLSDRKERLASKEDQAAFALARGSHSGMAEASSAGRKDVRSSVARPDGALAQLIPAGEFRSRVRMSAPRAQGERDSRECAAPECTGLIYHAWWSDDGKSIYFLGYGDILGADIYKWSPSEGSIDAVIHVDDDVLFFCAKAVGDRIVCVRQTPARPPHIATVDLRSGAVDVRADVNPEFENIQLGRIERYQWDLPKFPWNEPGGELTGLFDPRTYAYGYILYPPNFDPARKYPVFISPYVAWGFDHPSRAEHALHVYAANGFVVLNLGFPGESAKVSAALGSRAMSKLYSADLDFPYLSMLMESTVRGLDVAAKRGFIDRGRVGIGGVSTGTFVPLFMLQKHDLIAAISISSPHWNPFTYYWRTGKLRKAVAAEAGENYQEWPPKPDATTQRFWEGIDISDHVDTIEAPVLMNLADRETFGLLRLIRHMADAGKPYDTYVFPKEGHIKWQPAHLHSIMTRNLDWFRFWLQDYEDTAPLKAEQYARWRKLRELQCKNFRSLRAYCAPPAASSLSLSTGTRSSLSAD
jgi:dipeptidyl aminopeptidase/acylaminoacyl peptidase